MLFEDGPVFLTIEFRRCHNSCVIVTLNPVESLAILTWSADRSPRMAEYRAVNREFSEEKVNLGFRTWYCEVG